MKMPSNLSLLSLFILIHTCTAFDITQILNQYPEFSTFNSYLTQTNLASQINSRQTITVLVVDNGNMASISSMPVDLIKNILSVHVILDYYDAVKLQQLSVSSALVTTLFQNSGLARGQQGFLTVTSVGGSGIAFSSAMPGSPVTSTFVKSVTQQPYNISIIQVSSVIMPQGIDGSKTSSPPSTAPSTTPGATPPPPASVSGATPPPLSPVSSAIPPPPPSVTGATSPPSSFVAPGSPPQIAPATTPPQSSSATVPSTAPTTSSSAPVPSAATPTSSQVPSAPTNAPTIAAAPANAGTPSASPASTPIANAPGSATDTPVTEEPTGTTPAAEKPTGKSSGTVLGVGLAGVFTMVLSTLYLASTV